MCITCIQSIGKILGLNKRKKRFANSACHPEKSKFTSFWKVIYKCTGAVYQKRGTWQSEIAGETKKLQLPWETWKLISWKLSSEQKEPLSFILNNTCSAITSCLIQDFIHPCQFIRLLLRLYFSFLVGVILIFLMTTYNFVAHSCFTFFSF